MPCLLDTSLTESDGRNHVFAPSFDMGSMDAIAHHGSVPTGSCVQDRYATAVLVLNPLYVRGRLQSALAIGEHVIGAFYRGDPAASRALPAEMQRLLSLMHYIVAAGCSPGFATALSTAMSQLGTAGVSPASVPRVVHLS